MNIQWNKAGKYTICFALLAVLTVAGPQMTRAQQGGGQQAPAAQTGPMSPEKYKNIQVLTNVPADQMDATMHYVSASVEGRQAGQTDCAPDDEDGLRDQCRRVWSTGRVRDLPLGQQPAGGTADGDNADA